MYFPYLRGRQFELLALRELASRNLIGKNVFPIIEPVSASSTLITTVKKMADSHINVGLIGNPQVGTFFEDAEKKRADALDVYSGAQLFIIVDSHIKQWVKAFSGQILDVDQCGYIVKDADNVEEFREAIGNKQPAYAFGPDERFFRRLGLQNKVLLQDPFDAKDRNVDYPDEVRLFSDDHLYYKEEGYFGFSDYSIIGDRYSEGGFLPYCVVLHIVYFNEKKELMIAHFKSDSNESTDNPAGKFYEALGKFVVWNRSKKLETFAAQEFERLYQEGAYPGLGTIKKLCLMHHLELMNRYLEGKDEDQQ